MLRSLPDFDYDANADRRFWYELPLEDVEIDGECYETVVVDGWEPDGVAVSISEEGELLAEISIEPSTERASIIEDDDEPVVGCDDCTNLSWLMNFRIDELVNGRVATVEQPQRKLQHDNEDESRKSAKSRRSSSSPCDEGGAVEQKTKPPYTYTKLIEFALRDKGELTVSGIYQWISERFPFFKPQDDKWKNSVRHNLSINPHFRKGPKAKRGAGHLWTVATPCAAYDQVIDFHKKMKSEPTLEQEVAAAAASILQQHPSEFLNPVSVEEVAAECGLLDGPLTFTY